MRSLFLATLVALVAAVASSCGGEGAADTCATGSGGLVGCPPGSAATDTFTVEDACRRLIDCGVIAVQDDNSNRDFQGCLNRLLGDDFPPERLDFTLSCIQTSTCRELAEGYGGTCFEWGGNP